MLNEGHAYALKVYCDWIFAVQSDAMAEQIKKKVVLVSLEDVLVPGRVVKEVNKKAIKEILENLSKLDKEGKITLILVSGFKKDVMDKKIAENSIGKYFRSENIHCATEDYISKREEVSAGIERLLAADGPCLAHVIIDPMENVWPLVPPGKSNAEMMHGAQR